jgi:hypothetical protein
MRPRPFLPVPPAVLALLLAWLPAGAGDPVVVVSPESGIQSLSRGEVINIFLGRQKRLPSGAVALPVEQAQPAAIRAAFYEKIVNKDLPDINAYWARLLYSGQAQPPRQLGSPEAVLEMVLANPGAIGMLDGSSVNRRVRVVYVLGR